MKNTIDVRVYRSISFIVKKVKYRYAVDLTGVLLYKESNWRSKIHSKIQSSVQLVRRHLTAKNKMTCIAIAS